MPDKVKITKTKLDNLANAVAAKSGQPVLLTVDQMTDAVLGINLGEENILEGVKVNNIELPIVDKKVNIPAATVSTSNPGKLATAGVVTQKLWDYIGESFSYYNDQINSINNAGYITEETDPTVPSWAKQSTKPTYTATEVGALPDTTVIPEDKVFIATYSVTTYADTLDAYNAKKLIFAVINNDTNNGKTILPLTRKTLSEFQFEGQYLAGLSSRPSYSLSSSGWTNNSTYGNIITRNADITSGDRLIIRDIDDHNTTKSSSLTFGTATNQYLANNGTWQTIPENVSDLTNDSGYLTEETDPTVPSWAKASTKPSYNFSEIGSTPTTISGYGITDAYTRTQVDGLVAGVLHYKGTKATVSALPSSNNTTGDTWHVTADGSEWAWDGTTWQELGTAVDLSDYVTTDDSRLSDARTPTAHNQALSTITGADDLKAIEGLTGTSGLLKKTAANTWTLDTSNYLTSYTETDPVFSASAAANISSTDISNWNSKTSNTGTVTSIGLSNATNGGLTISGSPVTNSGSITVGHSNVLSSAQTTQAVYPIKIDKNGHISAYGSAVSIPTKVSDLTNDSGFISSYTETDPVFSASAAADITSTDISNWNAKVSDTGKWNNVTLSKSTTGSANNYYLPALSSTSGTTAYLYEVTNTPANNVIAKYDNSAYLKSTTPSANDNSTKVATTAYVDNAIPKVYSSTNTSGYLTMATLPIYDGTVV